MRYLLLILTLLILSEQSYSQTFQVTDVQLVATLQPLEGVNRTSNDFSPIMFNDKLYFTSSRPYNQHIVGENNWDKNGYVNIFYGSIFPQDNGGVRVMDIRLLSNKLNSGSHTGPLSFSSTGDTLFFTRVVEMKEGKERIGRPQLFQAIKKKGKWTKVKTLPFSDERYSFGHPSYDTGANRLYFTSDKPGGKGKSDVYYTEIGSDGNWITPVNIEEINTAYDERFPFAKNGNLFYSSNRPGGQGKMDIYFHSFEESEYPITLEGINSPYDDFGLSFQDNLSSGYFSSNRDGNDDIFYFTIERKITVKNQIAGSFTFRNLSGSAQDLTVQIYDDEGGFVFEQKTDENGLFKFEDLEWDSSYTIRIDGIAEDEMTLKLFDENGNTTANYIVSETGSFKYKKLFYNTKGIAELIPSDMIDFEHRTAILSGKLVLEEDPNRPIPNSAVNLVDEDYNIVFSDSTDANGNFRFENLDIDKKYFIQIPECSEKLLLYIYGKSNAIYTQLKCNGDDNFMYRRLKSNLGNRLTLMEKSEDIFMLNTSEIIGRFDSENGKYPLLVKVYTDEGVLLDSTETDEFGNFSFDNLSSDNAYKFTTESTEGEIRLTLFNRYNKEVAKIQAEEQNYFIYRPLGYQTDYSLSLMDGEIEFNLMILDRYDALLVFFDVNETEVKSEDVKKLTRLYKLMTDNPEIKLSVSAYADATASDEYNFLLSQKRGEWIVNYLIRKGINEDRFTINAYGETQLIDPENDAINRRAELRLYK